MEDDLLSIGRFTWLTGLSVGALRSGRIEARSNRLTRLLHITRQHARRSVEINEGLAADARETWDLPAAYEAMARASFAAGDPASGALWKAKATAALEDITDPDDREPIAQDFATLPG